MNADMAEKTAVPELADLPRLDVRNGHPVVEVRDRNLWHNDPRTREILPDLEQAGVNVEAIYDGVVEDFWTFYAPEAARSVGYPGAVWSEGRSSGWIYPDGLGYFLDYVVPDADGRIRTMHIPEADDTADPDTVDEYNAAIAGRDRFFRFAAAIKGALETAESEYVDQLKAAHADLERRREEAIVRGED